MLYFETLCRLPESFSLYLHVSLRLLWLAVRRLCFHNFRQWKLRDHFSKHFPTVNLRLWNFFTDEHPSKDHLWSQFWCNTINCTGFVSADFDIETDDFLDSKCRIAGYLYSRAIHWICDKFFSTELGLASVSRNAIFIVDASSPVKTVVILLKYWIVTSFVFSISVILAVKRCRISVCIFLEYRLPEPSFHCITYIKVTLLLKFCLPLDTGNSSDFGDGFSIDRLWVGIVGFNDTCIQLIKSKSSTLSCPLFILLEHHGWYLLARSSFVLPVEKREAFLWLSDNHKLHDRYLADKRHFFCKTFHVNGENENEHTWQYH